MTRHEEPRRWWQVRRRRTYVECPCGWRSDAIDLDPSGLGEVRLTFAEVNHNVVRRYRCSGALP